MGLLQDVEGSARMEDAWCWQAGPCAVCLHKCSPPALAKKALPHLCVQSWGLRVLYAASWLLQAFDSAFFQRGIWETALLTTRAHTSPAAAL